MSRRLVLAATLAIAATGTVAHAQAERATPNPSAMSIKEIRIHNASLSSDDPQYIVCKRQTVTGSLAKKQRTCLTNQVWAQRADRAREFASRVMDNAMNECETNC